jgi:hypothetical protein
MDSKRSPKPTPNPKPPTAATLKKYGLSAEEWLAILAAQGNVCPICKKTPSTGRWYTDHEHVRGWTKMAPELRKQFVRGILCYWCNATYVGRGMTIAKAANVVRYLAEFEARRKPGDKKEGSGPSPNPR